MSDAAPSRHAYESASRRASQLWSHGGSHWVDQAEEHTGKRSVFLPVVARVDQTDNILTTFACTVSPLIT